MAGSDWPQCPEIRGRPLDTALLLNKDHVTDLRHRLRGGYDDDGHVPGEVILPLLDNIDTLYDALSRRGPVRDHALDSLYDLHDVGFKIRGCARLAAPDRRQILPYADSIEEWEDEEEEVDIKAESPSMGDSHHPVVALAPKRMTLRKKGGRFNNRNPRVVTIRVADPDLQSEVLHLGQAQVADMVSSDMVLQGLGPGSFSSTRILSGDVRLMMPTARRASALKDRQRFRPLSFGKCAYVQQFRPLGRGVLLCP
ncbi:MAG: hypothetical protein L6R36_006508 [Xanthoria steineri]|nr:MAG: hypothetical protein L6R36_006508 [Xanthoria steineri]